MTVTIEDANQLLGIAEANFNYAFKNMSHDQKVTLVKTWAFGLQDIPADIVMLAFMQLTTTSKWLPNVAEIREQVRELHDQARRPLAVAEDMERLNRIYAEMMGEALPQPAGKEETREDAIRRYIVRSTEHLSGRDGPGLQLNTLLNEGGFFTALGSGHIGFAEIGGRSPYVMIEEGRD